MKVQPETRVIRPQPGPQERFLASSADIAIYGGSAGAGKSFALLLEPLRHIANPDFGATIFRRTTPQITNEGALWDESVKLYGGLAEQKLGDLSWRFPAGSSVGFAHLEHDKTVLNYQGSQIPYLGFDEITHFTAAQFWYMLSRNRSMCGVRPYVRATCNPDPDSFVAELIAWWIDDNGFPIPERSGVLRWFIRMGDKLIWGDKPEDLASYLNPYDGKPIPPKSLTFISAKLSDNPALLAADPGYVANLMALPAVEQARLMGGNWKIRNTKALVFSNWKTEEFTAPADAVHRFGADWGFAVDPTVLVRCHIIGDRLYVDHEAYEAGCEIDDTPALFDQLPGVRQWTIRADSARPETVSYMQRKQFKIIPAIKGPGSIEDGIKFLQSYHIIVHPRCVNTIRELQSYSYKTDPFTDEVLPLLEDKNNHVIDALRYACEAVRKAARQTPVTPTRNPPDLWGRAKGEQVTWKTT